MAVPVWGWAEAGEKVTIKFRGQKVSTTAKYGKWSVTLRKLKAGGPDVLTIATKAQTLQFTNVLVGEVWVCSGQSNMEWPLSRSFQPEAFWSYYWILQEAGRTAEADQWLLAGRALVAAQAQSLPEQWRDAFYKSLNSRFL
jgi:hypothetical protein